MLHSQLERSLVSNELTLKGRVLTMLKEARKGAIEDFMKSSDPLDQQKAATFREATYMIDALEDMNSIDQYQKLAHTTAIYPIEFGLSYTALALAGEAGEVAGKVSKVYRDNNGELSDEAKADILKELGDVLWQAQEVASFLNVKLSDVCKSNLIKLANRKKKGMLGGKGDNRGE